MEELDMFTFKLLWLSMILYHRYDSDEIIQTVINDSYHHYVDKDVFWNGWLDLKKSCLTSSVNSLRPSDAYMRQ